MDLDDEELEATKKLNNINYKYIKGVTMADKNNKKQIVINNINYLECFKNDKYEGFKIGWGANIGFGEMTFLTTDEGIKVETECMSDNNNKEFIKLVLNKFIEQLDVIE